MASLYKWAIMISFIVAALVCYGIGFSGGAVGFAIAGVLFEMMFWSGLIVAKREKRKANYTQ